MLFHRGVLGLDAQESVDVADPYGLLRSRAVTNADGSVRLALTVGAAPGDDTAHARHIALATDDMVAAARRFREAGGRLLPIPANYYDDLEARFEFADGELETYRELGILYDRDEHGVVPALLHPHRRPRLLRVRPARRRLPGLRRRQRAGAAGRPAKVGVRELPTGMGRRCVIIRR